MKRAFNILIKEFAENLDIRENSRALYLRILKQFAQWVVTKGKNIKLLKRSDILEYKSSLLSSEKSENTIDSYLTVLRMFYDYCELSGEHENIAAGIKVRHKRSGYRKGHLNTEQISALYNSIDREKICGMRDYAIINLMLRTGVRCIEVSRIRICDIEEYINGGSIAIQRKGDNDRGERIGVTYKVIKPLIDYIQYRGVNDEKEIVFVSHGYGEEHPLTAKGIGQIVTKHLIKAGLHSKTITPHSLRHTAAVQAILHRVPIKEVQLMLGHRSPKTTEIYLKSVDDEMRLNNPAVRVLDDVF